MERQTFASGGKTAVLYPAAQAGSPLIVLCEYEGDGEPVVRALQEMGAPACSLLVTGGGEWNRDMSPWAAPAVFKGGEPFTGGADGFLTVLLGQILPEARERIGSVPAFAPGSTPSGGTLPWIICESSSETQRFPWRSCPSRFPTGKSWSSPTSGRSGAFWSTNRWADSSRNTDRFFGWSTLNSFP